MAMHLIGYGRLFVLVVALVGLASTGETAKSAQSVKVSGPKELVAEVFELTDLVLDKHIDPPTRQQMLLAGVKEVYRSCGKPAPHGLARRLSQAVINQAFPRGPARLAGAKSNDRILSVDGIEMKGKSLRDYIDALRGFPPL